MENNNSITFSCFDKYSFCFFLYHFQVFLSLFLSFFLALSNALAFSKVVSYKGQITKSEDVKI